MADGPVLFYAKDGILYPVAMSESQYSTLKMLVAAISPLTIVKDSPIGEAINLLEAKNNGPH